MKCHLVKIMHVEAAHRNPEGNPAQQRLHGHSYEVEILASGAPTGEIGWVVDFSELKQLFQPLYEQLDHAFLNQIEGLEEDSTLPAVERWIHDRLPSRPDWLTGVRVSIASDLSFQPVLLPEDPLIDLPARYRFMFEAAQCLPQLPEGHPCRNIHGHSYSLEAGARDLDRLQAVLPDLYALLDHRSLNDIEGLDQPTCERITRWVWDWLCNNGVSPNVVIIKETDTARCLYFGE